MNKKNNRKGFTTVELVIVIAVIAILATALIPTFAGLIDSANETKAMNKAREIFNNAIADDLGIFNKEGTTYSIYADGYYFQVEGGKLNTKGSKTAPSGTVVYFEEAAADPYYATTNVAPTEA